MGALEDPFEALTADEATNNFTPLREAPLASSRENVPTQAAGALIARFHGFDIEDRPLVSGIAQLPGEVVLARTTVPLLREVIGSDVVVLCEQGNPRRPIIMGIISSRPSYSVDSRRQSNMVSIQADEDRYVISAEREIVLRCGDSSITLTRAGKVIIKGNYILSRSTGYNKIKGAAVDIN